MSEVKVTQEQYSRFIDGMTLKAIKIMGINAKVDEKFNAPANVKIQEESSYSKIDDKNIKIYQKYVIEASKNDDSNAKFMIEVHYSLLYSVTIPIDDEIFKIFSKSSLLLQTWPFLRQLAHQMTYYMNLPPLVLDVIKVQTQKSKE